MLERAQDLGGTWRENTYPGCACDVPSNLYSFSFAPNPDWSQTFSPQPEIWEYLRRVSGEHGIDPHIRYGHEVTAARWDAQAGLWRIETAGGDLTADMLVAAAGPLSDPEAAGDRRDRQLRGQRSSTPRAGTASTCSTASGSP